MKDLSVKIHEIFMEKQDYECPSFYELFDKTEQMYPIDNTEDMRFMAEAIDECSNNWDTWTAEWRHEMKEAEAQTRWENANRGEI